MDLSLNEVKEKEEGKKKEGSQAPQQMPATLPAHLTSERLPYPSRDGTYFSQLYSQPLVTTLTSFSHVANLVRSPYEQLINNVDEFVKQARGVENRRKYQRTSENFAVTLNQNRQSSTSTTSSPVLQEMDTFVASSHDQSNNSFMDTNYRHKHGQDQATIPEDQTPIPALPPIESASKRNRLEPLTIEEYESKFRKSATDLELMERVFSGSMSCNQLRAALWPYLFGIVKLRGSFELISNQEGQKAFLFVEHEENIPVWTELQRLYFVYQNQWKSVLPDQELRFSAFRECKSLIERDVIRCDRLHPFYAEQPQNLAALTNLLMTYMMYDFDIGYVQGMSDLAAPILCAYNGDLIKSFWVFVELSYLFQLIKSTDPDFAKYLEEHESSNCFFAFRAIVCLFKRELMKEDEADYGNVLLLWDTIWCAKRLNELKGENKPEEESCFTDSNQSNSPRSSLTETEIFVLSLCLSMIRRDRNFVLANNLDGTDIHLHFINPKLASNLNSFIEDGINIYSYIRSDIKKLTTSSAPIDIASAAETSPQGSPCSYDLLKDFLIIT